MRIVKTIVKWVTALVLLLVAGVLGVGLWYVRSVEPQVAGTITLPGFQKPVEVLRDHEGVPHIFAESDLDALAALGPLAPKLIGSEPDATPAENLAALSRLLAAEIRAGKWDGDEQTHEALLRATRAYLAESNPKALARARTQEKPRRDDGA